MPLIALGVNHKTAPVEIRERIAFDPGSMQAALQKLTECPAVNEGVILSTCNRTELYCGVDEADIDGIVDWLGQYHHVEQKDLRPYIYSYPDQEAVRHMLRVASGLDSMILGEPQILGQMKDAYQDAMNAGTTGRLLGRLFQHTFLVAKQVRTDTAIGSSPISIAFAAVSLAKQIFGDLSQQTVLLIGAGETIELAARHLHQNNIGRIIVANRTVERARSLAEEFQGYAIALNEIGTHLHEADIVISSTASPTPILTRAMIEPVLKTRKHRPIFMVDIAVPRDISQDVSELEDIYLYTVDDMQEVIQENLKSRQEAAKQAEEIIDTQTAHFMGWLRSLDSVSTIRNFRDQASALQQDVLEQARKKLQQGKTAEETIEWLAHTLTNKIIHTPSVQMRNAAFEDRRELLDAARTLFDLTKS